MNYSFLFFVKFLKAYNRLSLRADSLASEPELAKKTLSAKVRLTSFSANFKAGSFKK